MAMNRYGEMAMAFAREHRPVALRQLEDPQTFFTGAGEEIAELVGDVMARLQAATLRTGPMSTQQARTAAEGVVLQDHWLFVPEADPTSDPRTMGDDPEVTEHFRDLAAIREATRSDW